MLATGNHAYIHRPTFIYYHSVQNKSEGAQGPSTTYKQQESLALVSMARDDPPAISTASSTAPLSTAPASSTAAAMRGKVGSEFET